ECERRTARFEPCDAVAVCANYLRSFLSSILNAWPCFSFSMRPCLLPRCSAFSRPVVPAELPDVPADVLLEPLPAVVLPRPCVEDELVPDLPPLPAAEPPVPIDVLLEPL